ncbi:hypothetical protein [Nostoc sp. PCC 7524]|uniref:hypothetical protein n=1 Tax=Nostoc sp. (strain ATCC 29411 / PCC 7524) TaxID=28072 RepID=UPI001181820F|nr:hypothetical protein [Nostoc sp. PCC 7524]
MNAHYLPSDFIYIRNIELNKGHKEMLKTIKSKLSELKYNLSGRRKFVDECNAFNKELDALDQFEDYIEELASVRNPNGDLVPFTVEDLVDTVLDIKIEQSFLLSEVLKIQEKLEDIEDKFIK